jgi:hypothetical protein
MPKKDEIVKKKDRTEIVKVLVVGFLLVLVPLILISSAMKDDLHGYQICHDDTEKLNREQPPPGPALEYMAAPSCFGVGYRLFYALNAVSYFLITYIVIGVVLYLASIKIGVETKGKVRFWAKSFIAGAIITLLIMIFSSPIFWWVYSWYVTP